MKYCTSKCANATLETQQQTHKFVDSNIIAHNFNKNEPNTRFTSVGKSAHLLIYIMLIMIKKVLNKREPENTGPKKLKRSTGNNLYTRLQ